MLLKISVQFNYTTIFFNLPWIESEHYLKRIARDTETNVKDEDENKKDLYCSFM